MTEYTITIEGYTSGLTESAVEQMVENDFPRADSIEVEIEE